MYLLVSIKMEYKKLMTCSPGYHSKMWSDLSNDSQILPQTDNLNDINSAMDHFFIISQLVGIFIYLRTIPLNYNFIFARVVPRKNYSAILLRVCVDHAYS